MAGTELASVRQFQRPDQPKLPDGRSNSWSVTDEDQFDINSVANVSERPRVKCATNVWAPDDGDGSSRCRTPWCGGVRGVLANLQKRATECYDCVSRPDQDETLEKINPGTVRRSTGDGGKLGVFAANALLRPVLTVERRKGLQNQLRPFLAVMRTLPLCGVLW